MQRKCIHTHTHTEDFSSPSDYVCVIDPTDLLTDRLTHWVIDEEPHHSQRSSASSCFSFNIQPESHHWELCVCVHAWRCLCASRGECVCAGRDHFSSVTDLTFASNKQVNSESAHRLQLPCREELPFFLKRDFICIRSNRFLLISSPPWAAFRAGGNSTRRQIFVGTVMSIALQGAGSHFREAGLSLYSLLPRI